MPDQPSPRVAIRRIAPGGFYDHDPLPDDAVVRFRLTDNDAVTVELDGDTLKIHHEGCMGGGPRIAIRPEVSNVVSIVLVPRED